MMKLAWLLAPSRATLIGSAHQGFCPRSKERDPNVYGIAYSDPGQAGYCPVEYPAAWPVVYHVPQVRPVRHPHPVMDMLP